MAKKNTAAKSAKKVVAPKAVKAPKTTAKFVSFSVGAVIPTQQYGNIQPRIEVSAANYEDARAFAMPLIEKLYSEYAEAPLNGREPKFLGKIEVVEKKVAPAAPAAPQTPPAAPTAPASAPMAHIAPEAPAAPAKAKSDAVLKAEKAIGLALSNDALIAIGEQIQKSVKIAEEDKPDLIVQVLKRRNEFK